MCWCLLREDDWRVILAVGAAPALFFSSAGRESRKPPYRCRSYRYRNYRDSISTRDENFGYPRANMSYPHSVSIGNGNVNCGNVTNSNNIVNNVTNGNNIVNVNKVIADENPEIMQWLSPLDPRRRHQDVRTDRLDGVGDWLLETNEFRGWRSNGGGADKAVLFCCGDPGVGKTYLR